MNTYDWAERFQACYNHAVKEYAGGNRDRLRFFTSDQVSFLYSIGCTVQEVYDFAEDWCGDKQPTFGTALLITAARRDYLMVVQHGKRSERKLAMADFPAKDAEVAGIAWLPRLILKARCKLRGELPDDLMYGCGGDRAFLSKVGIHPADFLRQVWAAGDDDQRTIDYVRGRMTN